jgi:hypothetical protein
MMATGNARGGTPMANEIFEASAGFLIGTGEGAQVLLGGLARKCRVGPFIDAGSEKAGRIGRYEQLCEAVETEVSQHRFGVRRCRDSRHDHARQ